jgi:4-carboxymuconolactone decarboxylase
MIEPRIAPVTDPDPEVEEILDKTRVAPGPPANIFTTMAHHPRLLKRFNVLGGLFLSRGLLPAREREIVILRTAWRTGSEYEFGQHTLIGRRAGLNDDEIRRVTMEAAEWPGGDRLLIELADEIHASRDLPDDLWNQLRKHWTDAQMIELVMLAGFYQMVSGFLKAVRVQLDRGIPGWPVQG